MGEKHPENNLLYQIILKHMRKHPITSNILHTGERRWLCCLC